MKKLTLNHMSYILEFCQDLKEEGLYPCSFWGYDEKVLEEYFCSPEVSYFGEIKDEKLICLGKLERGGAYQEHFAEISLAVLPKFRQQNVASQLLRTLEGLASSLELRFLKAVILENNPPSLSFFAGHGYEKKATLFDEFNIEGVGLVNDLIFHKSLI